MNEQKKSDPVEQANKIIKEIQNNIIILAGQYKTTYDAFIKVGFTEQQAMQLVNQLMMSLFKR